MRSRVAGGWMAAGLCSLLLLAAALTAGTSLSWLATPAAAQDVDKVPGDVPQVGSAAEPSAGVPASKSKNMLRWLYTSLGPMYSVIFLVLSFCLVAVIVMNVLSLRRNRMVPATLVSAFEASLKERRFQEALELANTDDSFLGRVLTTGMANLSLGQETAAKAMEDAGAEEVMRLEHQLGYVALIAQIGPMFGLLGTVDGMVQAFEVIAASNQTPKPNQLAQGIGTALVTTVVGLWIAIPSIAFFTVYRARLARLIQEAGFLGERLLQRSAAVGAGKA